jgi:hypothetical protein
VKTILFNQPHTEVLPLQAVVVVLYEVVLFHDDYKYSKKYAALQQKQYLFSEFFMELIRGALH